MSLASSWLSGRMLDWRLSPPGFDPSFGNLACLATLMSSDRMKTHLSVDDYIYIMELYVKISGVVKKVIR